MLVPLVSSDRAHRSAKPISFTALLYATAYFSTRVCASSAPRGHGLQVDITVAEGLLNTSTDGRISLMFAPAGVDPLEDTEVDSSPNKFFGKNVFDFASGDTASFSGGSGVNTRLGVYGWPNVSLDEISPGNYTIQAFLNIYEKAIRSDGSQVAVRFPCGDGALNVDGFGSLLTPAVDLEILGGSQLLQLEFNKSEPTQQFAGHEVGGCRQGSYEDTTYLKYVKIRSPKLSEFWGRDMYVGANVLLPHGYDAENKTKRYPVVYQQGHWPADSGAFGYPDANFSASWDNGNIAGRDGSADRPTPKMILVTIRHEAPFYDDSYGVNTANMGPYGDAINDELIPNIDATFNTIAQPWARVQEGGSTGGWISAASVIYRPDLFGACFSSYPDSLDFHRHQDIHLYDSSNAYYRPDGSAVGSIRTFKNNTEVVLATVAQENHWELTFGTSSRSFLQWDVWNAVFGAQGLNGYPLEPWNKVTGEIYHDAVEYWKPFDLSRHITSNWHGSKNLGEVLRRRIFIYVGTHDNYYLNEGVQEFHKNVARFGGDDWANVTILEGQTHGGNYQRREIWNYLEFLNDWFDDHSPIGKTPLSANVTDPTARGNLWEDVIRAGGRQAALDRQAPPKASVSGRTVEASVGRWDPGVQLEAQWQVDGKAEGKIFPVKQKRKVKYVHKRRGQASKVQISVTGKKMGYVGETRRSNVVDVRG